MSSYFNSEAVLSADGTYRYLLHRSWKPPGHGSRVLWVMLNPSTADAEQDDPTIRRCVGFSKAWGFSHLTVANLWALRSTDPSALLTHSDPTGPENWWQINQAVGFAQLVVAAWGATVQKVLATGRARIHVETLARDASIPVRCLGLTKSGHPRHPLYVRADTELVPFGPWEGT